MKTKPITFPALLVLASLALLGPLASPAQATDYTWLGEGFSHNWDDATGNWEQPYYPGYQPLLTADTATFGPVTQSYYTVVSTLTNIKSLTYNAPGYSLNVSGSLIVAEGITATYDNAPLINVASALYLSGTSTVGTLTGSGALESYSSSGTVNVVGPSSTFSGVIGSNLPNLALTVGDGTHAASLTLNLSSYGPNAYTGTTLVQANATLVAAGAGTLSSLSPHQVDGTLALASGANAVASLSGTGTVNLGANQLTVTSGPFGGTITGTGGTLVKSGTGTLTLTGANTYTGTTTITGGRLNVNNSIAGGALVQTGGTLGGTGSIGGAVTVQSGGTLAPGTSPGQLTLLSGLTLQSGSTLEMEFDGTTPGLFDQLDVQGLFAAGGTLQLTIDEGYTPALGDSFNLFNGTTPGFNSGSFLISTNLGEGLAWDTSALGSLGVVSVVPEPSTWILLAAGVLSTVAWTRRSGSRNRCHSL